jgi:hypothetical protein
METLAALFGITDHRRARGGTALQDHDKDGAL